MRESTLKSSVLLRLVIIGALAIVLLIPTLFVGLLVSDRQSSRAFAIKEVAEKWGTAQTITGPVLTVPVTRQIKDKEGEMHTHTTLVRILPEVLDVKTQVTPEVRQRGIYRVILYSAQVTLQAEYGSISKIVGELTKGEIRWEDASLTLGVSDLKGISNIRSMAWDGRAVTPEPGLRSGTLLPSSLTVRPAVSGDKDRYLFSADFDLRGSEEFRVVPAGRETRLSADASWGDPSFVGDFLPDRRDVGADSFSASWRVLDFNRNIPQSWVGDEPALTSSSFGVKLLLPVDEYQKTFRALKYAIMFIALTFLAFFVLDVMAKSPFHPVQYALVGFGLVLFYVLLLSISEYLPFDVSYWIASVAISLLITLYTRGATARFSPAAVIGGCLLVLYGFLFVLLQLEDYALLLGSIGLFAILALVMYLTRRIDWFGMGSSGRSV